MRSGHKPNSSAVERDEIRYRLLRQLERQPNISQRQLAADLRMSVGKANYCLRALSARGLIKMRNFRDSRNKAAYMYVLTPRGLREKARVTARFLQARIAEYDALAAEIEQLRLEAEAAGQRG